VPLGVRPYWTLEAAGTNLGQKLSSPSKGSCKQLIGQCSLQLRIVQRKKFLVLTISYRNSRLWVEGKAQAAEHQPSKCKAPGSNPSTAKKKFKKRK
jgi:hypothetical protein